MRRARRDPLGTSAALAALAIGLYVLVAPFAAARYPMMTDLPFHAANASIIRHYFDPSWHFQEQFVLQPLRVPYLSSYLLSALFMLVADPIVATKISTAAMLALLPAGLCVLLRAMGKSALLALLGVPFMWCALSSWGFVNHLGALGLFAMVVGLTLRLARRPTRAGQWALGAALVTLFFTHVFRFPFAICAVLGVAVVMYPATRRWPPIALPLAPPLALFAVWWLRRPAAVAQSFPLTFEPKRLDEMGAHLFHSFRGPMEGAVVDRALQLLGAVAAALVLAHLVSLALRGGPSRAWRWRACATVVVACCVGAFLLMFLTLPMQVGDWWYIYPREITSAAYLALALFPDVPRRWGLAPAAFVIAAGAAVLPHATLVVAGHRRFHEATRDFTAIVRHLPPAPKLLYLVFDHGGTDAVSSPFLHLPAYVQATNGGWLGFHFASWGATPIAYRPRDEPGAVVPPPLPGRWEWTPQRFEVLRHGRFAEWILVRRVLEPDHLFRGDPGVEKVAHEGRWWLYRRK